MSGSINPGGAGTWSFLGSATTIGNLALDAHDGSSSGSLSNANLIGTSYAMIQASGYITWVGAGAIANAFWTFYLQVVAGSGGDAVVTAQKGAIAASAYFPDLNAGANYASVTQFIAPVAFDSVARTYTIDYDLIVQTDTVTAANVVIGNFDVRLIAVISNLPQP